MGFVRVLFQSLLGLVRFFLGLGLVGLIGARLICAHFLLALGLLKGFVGLYGRIGAHQRLSTLLRAWGLFGLIRAYQGFSGLRVFQGRCRA